MFVARNSGATNGQATLQLRTGSTIASTLFAFQGVDITTNFVNQQPLQAVVFTPVNPVLLQASQTYWLTVSSTFVAPTNGLVIGTGDAPIVNDATFAGNRFGDYDAQITPLPSNLTPLIRVNGVTAVPEPSACGLLAVTLIASWCGLRRSRIGRFPLPNLPRCHMANRALSSTRQKRVATATLSANLKRTKTGLSRRHPAARVSLARWMYRCPFHNL